ncbi:MAG: EamA family transporter [Clostridiales bacterium]|nr:EamA family transporter [Clostridiales bacterium]
MSKKILKNKGKISLVISAFIYGLAPILAKVTYEGGTNGITLTFLRAFLAVPLLFIIMISTGRSIRLTKNEFFSIVKLGVFGGALPILLLYASYNYISTGLATTLHFVYPLIIVLVCAAVYHERMTKLTLTASVLVTVGIFLFVDINTAADTAGIILALLSGVFYSFYVIYMDKSGLDKMDYIKLTFYVMLITSAATLAYGLLVHGISFDMTPKAWTYSVIISVLVTVFAMPLFQAGVREEGAAAAGILSSLEPITTLILGAVFLGELMGVMQLIGGAMILSGVSVIQRKD